MAKPLQTGKQTVQLSAQAPRGSRIRRDPPPVVKEVMVPDRDERDRRTVIIGILTFTLAILVILAIASSLTGWTPREYVANI